MNLLDLPLYVVIAGWILRKYGSGFHRFSAISGFGRRLLIENMFSDIKRGVYPQNAISMLAEKILSDYEAGLLHEADILEQIGVQQVGVIRRGE